MSVRPRLSDTAAILISPGAVDAYPPVQCQARLLSEAGYAVEVVTTFRKGAQAMAFAAPGVKVTIVHPPWCRGLSRMHRTTSFLAKITAARLAARGKRLVEIAFDPLGMLYSDMAPFRPSLRGAHFHESLQHIETSRVEQRLRLSLGRYQFCMAPDEDRAQHIRTVLSLKDRFLVVPNYPLRDGAGETLQVGKTPGFEVVYCGTIGETQKIDMIAASVEQWPGDAQFTIIGDDASPLATRLKSGLSSRVNIEGWMPYDLLRNRLASARLGISLLEGASFQWRSALGASNKRYQYMQAGLAQIGDGNPGVPGLIEGNGIGICLKTVSPGDIAAAVALYCNTPERCVMEGRRARRLYWQRYNYDRCFAPVIEMIEHRLQHQALAS
ncbi:glycosyltransferase involved in cell wall biosynthesis [Rhodoligotrophos appendicifer]|uniref:glycosyltransferase n=1 Tax=Rhodoligotrophos appendicifer TaxID=987056 RepID=UPI00117FBFAB|nr:glycosyltransferase [Rhodoligotrophos appendicifer]